MQRNVYFDNTKAILIILVVIGHVIGAWGNTDNSPMYPIYLFIFSFHMPVFVFVSGYFSKNLKTLPDRKIKYILLYVAASLVFWPISHRDLVTLLIKPFYVLWYMLALVLWCALLPLFTRLKHPIVISFLLAFIVGYISVIGPTMTLSRAFAFFPFFLLGYYTNMETLKSHLFNKKMAISLMALVFVTITISCDFIDHRWLLYDYSYFALGSYEWYSGFYRILLFGLAIVMGISFLSLVPQEKFYFTELGSQTLPIYLAHGWIIKALLF